jgi:hypothetical protein
VARRLAGSCVAAGVIGVGASGLKLKPWYLIPTDLTLDPVEAVRVYRETLSN